MRSGPDRSSASPSQPARSVSVGSSRCIASSLSAPFGAQPFQGLIDVGACGFLGGVEDLRHIRIAKPLILPEQQGGALLVGECFDQRYEGGQQLAPFTDLGAIVKLLCAPLLQVLGRLLPPRSPRQRGLGGIGGDLVA